MSDKPREIPQSGWGSGVVVDPKGDILTNNHVVAGATEISVHTSGGKQYEAEIVGTDPRTDLAVIRVKDKNASLPYARLGHSDALEVGEWVVAIGSPFGLSQTVTAGIVSAKGRSNLRIADYEDWIQTDAAINPGNSGGPLVNLDGEVVGINSAILTRGGIAANAGVGFAVPINMARNVMQQIIEHGKVVRSYMGVLIQPVTGTLAEKFSLKNTKGALVGEVLPDSPAKKAGFQTGDVVVRYDGKEVKDYNHLRILVAETKVGRKVKVDVIRNGKPKTLTVQPAELTDDKVASASNSQDAKTMESYGLGLQTLTPEIARQLGYEGVVGVVITAVEPGSAGAKAALQRGDVILEGEREKVESVKDFLQKIKSLDKNKKALLLVKTKGGTRFAVLAIE